LASRNDLPQLPSVFPKPDGGSSSLPRGGLWGSGSSVGHDRCGSGTGGRTSKNQAGGNTQRAAGIIEIIFLFSAILNFWHIGNAGFCVPAYSKNCFYLIFCAKETLVRLYRYIQTTVSVLEFVLCLPYKINQLRH